MLAIVFLLLELTSFAKESSVCPPKQHWVRAYYRRAYYKSDGTFVNSTNVTAHCQSNPPGYDKWKALLKNGHPPIWPFNNEHIKDWTDEEIERMIESMNDIPPELWSSFVAGIYRMDRSHLGSNPATSGQDGTIVFYDSAFDKSYNLTEVLSHELAHINYLHLSPDDATTYHDMNGWIHLDDKNKWINHRKEGFVELDGRDSPEEDYANNVQYYLFYPNKLRLKTPTAYDWIKAHFGDKFKILSKGGK
jgi:hypothetical protein